MWVQEKIDWDNKWNIFFNKEGFIGKIISQKHFVILFLKILNKLHKFRCKKYLGDQKIFSICSSIQPNQMKWNDLKNFSHNKPNESKQFHEFLVFYFYFSFRFIPEVFKLLLHIFHLKFFAMSLLKELLKAVLWEYFFLFWCYYTVFKL